MVDENAKGNRKIWVCMMLYFIIIKVTSRNICPPVFLFLVLLNNCPFIILDCVAACPDSAFVMTDVRMYRRMKLLSVLFLVSERK